MKTIRRNEAVGMMCALVLLARGSVNGATYYVDAGRPDDSGDGLSWATAKRTIQAAVDLTVAGDTVLVTNGVYASGERVTPGYASSNRVVITKNITVRSVNGPAATIIQGRGPLGAGAVRCVYMTAGILAGFTLTNGFTAVAGGTYDRNGGGVYNGNGVVSNCVISGNRAQSSGGGAYGGIVQDSVISWNYVFESGGGVCFGTVNNCVISGNTADNGGGIFGSTANNCVVSGNYAYTDGGGAYGSSANNSVISGNEALDDGGGTAYGLVNNCVISGNTANNYAGGTYYGLVRNCLLSTNSARVYGGGMYESVVTNCTIVGNRATDRGGGTYRGTIVNSIVWGNSAAQGGNYYDSTLRYSCTTPLASGEGNITNDPQFLNAAVGNYRLAEPSPCINAGTNDPGMAWQTDLDGNQRIYLGDGVGIVDMGCYEYVPEPTAGIALALAIVVACRRQTQR